MNEKRGLKLSGLIYRTLKCGGRDIVSCASMKGGYVIYVLNMYILIHSEKLPSFNSRQYTYRYPPKTVRNTNALVILTYCSVPLSNGCGAISKIFTTTAT